MTTATPSDRTDYRVLATKLLTPHPDNPKARTTPAALAELVASIKAQGVQQPILARQLDGGFQVIYGHRRLAAAKLAGLAEVPVIVRALTDADALEAQLAENAGRRELDPMEQAHAFKTYLHRTKASQAQLAKRLGTTQGTVSSALALLALPERAITLLHLPGMTPAHGRELVRIKAKPELLTVVCNHVQRTLDQAGVPSSRNLRAHIDQLLDHSKTPGGKKPTGKKRGRPSTRAGASAPGAKGKDSLAFIAAAHNLALGVLALSRVKPVKVAARIFERAQAVMKLLKRVRVA